MSTHGQESLWGRVEVNELGTFTIPILQMRTIKVQDIHLLKAAQLLREPDLSSRASGLQNTNFFPTH